MTTVVQKIKGTAIRAPVDDLENHTIVLRQLKEVAEVGQRLRGDPGDSFVRLSELVNAGIVRLVAESVQAPSTNAPPGGGVPSSRQVLTIDSLQGGGSLSADLTLQLAGDAASPGNSFYYGTNGSGAKGFYALPSGGAIQLPRGATWVASSGAVSTATNDVPVLIPYACTLKEVVIMTRGGPGSCSVDVWKAAFGSYPPTSANSICGGTLPAISAGNTYQNSTLTGWTTAFSQDDVLMFHLVTSSTFTEVAIQLRMA